MPSNSDVEADVALSRCAPSGPRSLTPVVEGVENPGGASKAGSGWIEASSDGRNRERTMARYKANDLKQTKMIALSYADQLVEGSFEHALNDWR